MKLVGRLVPVAEVTRPQRERMFALMNRYYENVRRTTFEGDLDAKHWVIQVLDPRTGVLCGFSTQKLQEVTVAGQPVRALFSGDTIIAREHWGDQALAHVWGRLALCLIDSAPEADLYWFLISKGYKTYRFLPVFFREFYPHPDTATPRWARVIVDALGGALFPGSYDPGAGVVRGGPDKDRLRPGVAEISPRRRLDRFVRFFSDRNPEHACGEELCCLAPLSRANFTPAAYRVIGPEPALVEVPG